MPDKFVTVFLMATAGLTLVACQQNSETDTVPANENTSKTNGMASAEGIATATETPPQATIPTGCKINNAYSWTATVNAQPPANPRLGVNGFVVFNTTGYKVELARKGTDFNPKIVTLELTITPPASDTITNPVISTIEAKASVPDVVRELEKVVINCGGAKLTEITDIKILD